jgi:hypothetical protein
MACLETMLSRRQLLAASPTTLPLFLALSGCKGPAVLSAPPVVSQQTQVLLHAVDAEQNLIWIYAKVMSAYSGLAAELRPLHAEHQAHLAQLRARVIEPPGSQPPGSQPPGPVTARPHVAGTKAAALAQLRAAEQAAVTAQMSRLAAAPASLAQLYASIAASESTHVSVLSDVGKHSGH